MGSSYRLPDFAPESWSGKCYICNERLVDNAPGKLGTRTLEHVIPQWLAKAYRISDVPLSIAGDKRVTYKNYVVPCCRRCNCYRLGPLEKFLKEAFANPARGPNSVSRLTLSLWCCKILAAARMYSELLQEALPESAEDGVYEFVPSVGKCVHRRISRKELCYKFLGRLNSRVEVSNGRQRNPFVPLRELDFPFSAEAFRTKVPTNIKHQFDYHLDTYLYAIYLRFGCWMLVACLDGGYISYHAHEYFNRYREFELAPLQAEEMAAHFFTMAYTARCYKNYTSRVDKDGIEQLESTAVPIAAPFVNSDDYAELVHYLRFFTKEPRIEGWHPERGLATWLAIDDKGRLHPAGADDGPGIFSFT